MIRYVLAALLAVSMLGLAAVAIDAGASDNTERELRSGIADLEAAASELATEEELSPPDHPNPQRVVELTVPAGDLATESVTRFEVDPVEDADASVARYVLEDGTTNVEPIDHRIVHYDATDDRPVRIDGRGTQRLRLVLLPDADGDPVVVAEPPVEYVEA